jgi:hypothetical protein
MHALRRLCTHAPAIDLEGDVLGPDDPVFQRQALLVAAGEYRRRARRGLFITALLALMSFSSVAGLVMHYQGISSSNRSLSRRWISAVLFPVMTTGSALVCINHRRFARRLIQDADDPDSGEFGVTIEQA